FLLPLPPTDTLLLVSLLLLLLDPISSLLCDASPHRTIATPLCCSRHRRVFISTCGRPLPSLVLVRLCLFAHAAASRLPCNRRCCHFCPNVADSVGVRRAVELLLFGTFVLMANRGMEFWKGSVREQYLGVNRVEICDEQ
ncbi:hypothetical protein Tsubulata_024832, partial [Turnera subulata]